MEGYFFTRAMRGQMLYVPKNVIVMRDSGGGFDIDYSPNNLNAFDGLWKNDSELIAGLEDNPIISVLDISDELVHRFQNLCWKDDDISVLNRYVSGVELFRLSEKSVEKYRGLRKE